MNLPQRLNTTDLDGRLCTYDPDSTCVDYVLPAYLFGCGLRHNGISDRLSPGREEIVQVGPVSLGLDQSRLLEDAQVVR